MLEDWKGVGRVYHNAPHQFGAVYTVFYCPLSTRYFFPSQQMIMNATDQIFFFFRKRLKMRLECPVCLSPGRKMSYLKPTCHTPVETDIALH